MKKFIETTKKLALAAVALLCVQGASAETVAKIGASEYETLADAVAASQAGDVVSIVAANTYTLPGIPKNITIEGAVDGVVFNCTKAYGQNICNTSAGVTFKNVALTMSTENYTGFQTGNIVMENCTITGKFFSYHDMAFTGCKFIQDNSDYHMWIYGPGLVTFTNCEFVNNKTSKFFNLYCESDTQEHVVVFDKCSFKNNGSISKSALNVKATCGTKPLNYVLVATDCTTDGVKCKDESSAALTILSDLIQVDDRNANVASKIAVAEGTGITVDETGKIVSGTVTKQYKDEPAESFLANGVELVANADGSYTASINPDVAYVKVAEGFYQSAATYADSTDFYITNLEGLKYFRDVVNHAVTYYTDEAKTKELNYTSNIFTGKTVHMLADVDLGGEEWEPIGTTSAPFSGNYNGNDYTIANLVIEETEKSNLGLFGYTSNATIENLKIHNVSINGDETVALNGVKNVGAVVGSVAANVTTLRNITVDGIIKIRGNKNVGGLLYGAYFNAINCTIEGDEGSFVKAVYLNDDIDGDNVGGLAGYMPGEGGYYISGSKVSGITVTGTRKVGGLIGNLGSSVNVTDVEISNVTVGTTATAEYATDNKKAMGLGGLAGTIITESGSKGTYSGVVKDVTIAELPEGVAFENGNVNYGLVVGGLYGDLSDPAELLADYSALFAYGYAEDKYSNKYLLAFDKVAAVTTAEGVTTTYDALDDAIEALTANATLTLLDTFESDSTSKVEIALPAGATFDGAGKTLSGYYVVTVDPAGTTVKNTDFSGIVAYTRGKVNAKTAVTVIEVAGGDELTGKLVVENCSFKNVNNVNDNAAIIKVIPANGAEVVITGNTFEQGEQYVAHNFVLVQSDGAADFSANVTENTFAGDATAVALTVATFTDKEKVSVAGNTFSDPLNAIIQGYEENANVNYGALLYPLADGNGGEIALPAFGNTDNGQTKALFSNSLATLIARSESKKNDTFRMYGNVEDFSEAVTTTFTGVVLDGQNGTLTATGAWSLSNIALRNITIVAKDGEYADEGAHLSAVTLGDNTVLDVSAVANAEGKFGKNVTIAENANVTIKLGDNVVAGQTIISGLTVPESATLTVEKPESLFWEIADGSLVLVQCPVKVSVDGGEVTWYSTLTEAISAVNALASGDILVEFVEGTVSEGTVTINQVQNTGKKVTLRGALGSDGELLTTIANSAIEINPSSVSTAYMSAAEEAITFENILFDASGVEDTLYCIYSPKKNYHALNITVDNCKFVGNAESLKVAALQFQHVHNLTIKNVEVVDCHSALQVSSYLEGLSVVDSKVTNSKNGFSLKTSGDQWGTSNTAIEFVNTVIDVAGYGVRIDGNAYNRNITYTDGSIKAEQPFVVRKASTGNKTTTVTISEETAVTATGDFPWFSVTSGDDGEELAAPANTIIKVTAPGKEDNPAILAAKMGDTWYWPLATALAEAEDDDVVIELLRDNAEDLTLATGKTLTLVKNGFVYSGTVSPEADVVLDSSEDDSAYYYNAACVAQITDGDTTTKYASLAAALSAAQSSQTVELIDNVTVASTLAVFVAEKSVTLDLAGKTIAANEANPVFDVTRGELTIVDSSATAENETGSGYIAAVENGTAVNVAEDAKLSVAGGIISGDITGEGSVDITGGYFLDEVPYDRINNAYVRKGDKVEINGVEYYTVTAGSYVAILYRNNELVDKYETIKAAVESSIASGDIVRLVSDVAQDTLSTITLTGKDVTLDLNGKTVAGSNTVALDFTGDGSISITNGVISATGETRGLRMNDGAKVELCGAMVVNSANHIGIVAQNAGTKLTIGDKVEISGGTYGISVASSAEIVAGNELKLTGLANHALNAASGAVVTIGNDATLNAARRGGLNVYDASTVTVGKNAKIAVGARGTQVYNSNTSLTDNSKLVIGKNASIVSTGDYAVSIFAGGEVTVGEEGDESVIRTEGAGKNAIYNAGTFTLNGGSISVADTTFGTLAVNFGTFNFNGGKIEIAGGAFITGIENNTGAVLNVAGGELRVKENAGSFAYITKMHVNSVVNVTGGLFELLATSSIAFNAENGSNGALNISGGKFRIYHEGGNGMMATLINNLADASVAISGDAEFELADQFSIVLSNGGAGTVDITGGTFKSVNTSSSAGGTIIQLTGSSTGSVTIDGCDVDLSETNAALISNNGSGDITIAGGKYKFAATIANNVGSKISITGGEFDTTSTVASSYSSGATLEVSGGTFRTTNASIFSVNSGSVVKISDGVFTLTNVAGARGADTFFSSYGTTEISGGEFTLVSDSEVPLLKSSSSGTLVISGGHFYVPVDTLQCANGYLPYTDPASQWYAQNTERTVDIPYTVSAGIVAQVTLADGTVAYYTSIAEAFGHVEDGATVALLQNTSAAETVELFDENITVTLDFAGKMVTTTAEPLFNVTLGKLLLVDSSEDANGGISGAADKDVLTIGEDAAVAVSGGWYSKVILDAWCAEGYIPNKVADETSGLYTVKSSEGYIAKVFYAEGGEPDYFQELYDATDAADSDGDTVVILDDCALNDGLLITSSITLKGADKEDGTRVKLTGSAKWNNDSNVLIFDDEREANAEPLNVVLANIEFADFGKESKSAEGNSVIDAFFTSEEASLTVSNCAFTAYNHTAISVEGGTFEVVDSDFDGTTSRTGKNTGNGAIYATSAEGILNGVAIANLEGEIAALTVNGGAVNVTNTTITAANGVEVYSDELETIVTLQSETIVNAGDDGSAIYAEYPAVVQIEGGEYTGSIYGANDYTEEAVVSISGGYVNDDLSIFDIDNWVELSGGFYKAAPAREYCAEGYGAVANTGRDKNNWPYTVAVIVALNERTNTGYATLQDALKDAAAEDTIILYTDISLSQRIDIQSSSASPLTIDGNGHTVSAAEDFLQVHNGMFVITGKDVTFTNIVLDAQGNVDRIIGSGAFANVTLVDVELRGFTTDAVRVYKSSLDVKGTFVAEGAEADDEETVGGTSVIQLYEDGSAVNNTFSFAKAESVELGGSTAYLVMGYFGNQGTEEGLIADVLASDWPEGYSPIALIERRTMSTTGTTYTMGDSVLVSTLTWDELVANLETSDNELVSYSYELKLVEDTAIPGGEFTFDNKDLTINGNGKTITAGKINYTAGLFENVTLASDVTIDLVNGAKLSLGENVTVNGAKLTGAATAGQVLASGAGVEGVSIENFDVSDLTIPEGYLLIKTTDEEGGYVLQVAQVVAKIGDVPYVTLQSAVDAAVANDVITIVANISGETVAVATDGAITVTSELDEDGKALWTINNTALTITGGDTELTLVNLKFTGSSYVHAQNGAALTVDSVEAIVDPVKITGRSAFIVPDGNGTENTRSAQGLALTVKNSTIVNTCGTDYYGAAIFGWRFLSSVEIVNNTFGSEENRARFVTIKLMNATDGAVFNLSGNTVYGTNESYDYYAFDLYQNNSRANNLTVYSQDNIVDAIDGGVNDLYVFDIERNGKAASALVLLDNGTTLNGEAIVIDDILLEINDELFTGFHGVDVNWDENGKLLAGGVYNRALTSEELATYAAESVYSKVRDEDTYTLAPLVAQVVTEDENGEEIINSFDTLQSATDFVDELAAEDEPVITVLVSDVAEDDIPEGWYLQTADGITTLARRKALVVIPADTEGGIATTNVYSSFNAALAAANDGDTVVLLADVTMLNALTVAKNIDIDLNEQTLKLANAANNYIREGYDVTIANGTIDFNEVHVSGDCIIGVGGYGRGAATLTLDNVELVGKDYSSAYAALYVYENSTLNIVDSTLDFENELSSAGGAIKGTSTTTSTINIEHSTLDFKDVLRGITTGVVTVKDSTITIVGTDDDTGSLDNGINAVALTLEDSYVTITGGTGRGITVRGGLDTIIKGDSTLTISDMAEGDIMFQSDNTLAVYDTSVVSAGTVVLTSATTKLVDELLVAVDDTAAVRTFAAQIGRIPYDTFAEAKAAVQDGEVIVLLQDVTETVTLGEGESLTIDHNEHDATIAADEGLALLTSGEGPITYSTGVAVAKVIDGETEKLFVSFDEAFAEANSGNGLTLQLLQDVAVGVSGVAYAITTDMTIDGNAKTISTSTASKLFEVKGAATDVTFDNITLVNNSHYGRCVDTRKDNVTLTLTDAELLATGYQNQPLTVGGANAQNIVVNVTGSKIDAGDSGYAVVTFNTVKLTVEKSEINGYAAFYLKGKISSEGSAGSEISVIDSKLTTSNDSTYESWSSFGMFVMEDDNIDVTIKNTDIVINTSNTAKQGVLNFRDHSGINVSIDATSSIALNGETALLFFNSDPQESSIQVQGETLKAQFVNEGWFMAGVAGKDGWYTIVNFIGFDSYDGISTDKTDEISEWLTAKQDELRALELDEGTIAEDKGVAAYIFDDVAMATAEDITSVYELGIAAIAVESDTKLAVKLYLTTGVDEKVAYEGKVNGVITLKGKSADGETFERNASVTELSDVEFTQGKTDWLEFTVPADWAIVNPTIVLE